MSDRSIAASVLLALYRLITTLAYQRPVCATFAPCIHTAGCNYSNLANSIEAVLNREDLIHQQRREIADTLSTSSLAFEVDVEISAMPDT